MKILLLLPYDWDTAPSQRYRIEQWLPHLRREGVEFEVRTLLSAAQQHALYRTSSLPRKAAILGACLVRRLLDLTAARRCDAVWLHRAAWPLGPAVPERLLARAGVPIIYEF